MASLFNTQIVSLSEAIIFWALSETVCADCCKTGSSVCCLSCSVLAIKTVV